MSKHTPGPWKIGTPGPNGCYTVGTQGGLMTAMIAHSICEPDQVETANANARLIAAAPCLLEALQICVSQIRALCSADDVPDQAIAAIAKATGKEHAA
ncbi:hypothetical protein [Metapseudomonas otitidis]|uniref:hypothetical protein n=1 Tax=Metapseudomonas otitidis TaxID=319939 RepID=UPI00366D2356